MNQIEFAPALSVAPLEQSYAAQESNQSIVSRIKSYAKYTGAVLATAAVAFTGSSFVETPQAEAYSENTVSCPDAFLAQDPTSDPCIGKPTGTTITYKHFDDFRNETITTTPDNKIVDVTTYPASADIKNETKTTQPWGEIDDVITYSNGLVKTIITNPDGTPNSCNVKKADGQIETCGQYDAEVAAALAAKLAAEHKAHVQTCVNLEANLYNPKSSTLPDNQLQYRITGWTTGQLKSRIAKPAASLPDCADVPMKVSAYTNILVDKKLAARVPVYANGRLQIKSFRTRKGTKFGCGQRVTGGLVDQVTSVEKFDGVPLKSKQVVARKLAPSRVKCS